MTKNNRYEINRIEGKVILTKQFAKSASILNTPEYMTLLELRRNHPDYTFELREIRKKEGKKSYRNLTYEHMEDYIITREGTRSNCAIYRTISWKNTASRTWSKSRQPTSKCSWQ